MSLAMSLIFQRRVRELAGRLSRVNEMPPLSFHVSMQEKLFLYEQIIKRRDILIDNNKSRAPYLNDRRRKAWAEISESARTRFNREFTENQIKSVVVYVNRKLRAIREDEAFLQIRDPDMQRQVENALLKDAGRKGLEEANPDLPMPVLQKINEIRSGLASKNAARASEMQDSSPSVLFDDEKGHLVELVQPTPSPPRLQPASAPSRIAPAPPRQAQVLFRTNNSSAHDSVTTLLLQPRHSQQEHRTQPLRSVSSGVGQSQPMSSSARPLAPTPPARRGVQIQVRAGQHRFDPVGPRPSIRVLQPVRQQQTPARPPEQPRQPPAALAPRPARNQPPLPPPPTSSIVTDAELRTATLQLIQSQTRFLDTTLPLLHGISSMLHDCSRTQAAILDRLRMQTSYGYADFYSNGHLVEAGQTGEEDGGGGMVFEEGGEDETGDGEAYSPELIHSDAAEHGTSTGGNCDDLWLDDKDEQPYGANDSNPVVKEEPPN